MSEHPEAFEALNDLIGKRLNQEAMEKYKDCLRTGYIITRPDHYTGNSTHINMYICVNEEGRIERFNGDKCYGYYSGMYNRSHNTYDRPFTKKDIAYLKKYVKKITEP